MRKLFIGCGVVVVLILGLLGYVSYRVYPAWNELRTQLAGAVSRLDELDSTHAFDPQGQQHLDGQRFAASLDMRVSMAQAMQGTSRELEHLWDENDDSLGFFDRLNGTLGSFSSVLPRYAEQLQSAGMGPTEFAWCTKLFWATLYRVDAGAAGPELDPLKDQYARFKDSYERMAREQDWPPLAELIGEFAPAVLAEASTVMAADVQRVQAGLAVTELDFYYMAPLNKLMEVQALRIEAAVPPADGGK